MNQSKRAAKRFKRENRENKGAGTEAKRQAHNAKVRAARHAMGNWQTSDESMLLMAAALMTRR